MGRYYTFESQKQYPEESGLTFELKFVVLLLFKTKDKYESD